MRIEILFRVTRLFDNLHLGAQGIDARVFGHCIFVMIGGEVAEDETDGGHVLQTVVAIGWIVERPRFVDDAYRRFLRGNANLLDVFKSRTDLLVQPDRTFDGGLRVKFRRIRNLEKNILHDVGAEGATQL